jgi:hypothetical protein
MCEDMSVIDDDDDDDDQKAAALPDSRRGLTLTPAAAGYDMMMQDSLKHNHFRLLCHFCS